MQHWWGGCHRGKQIVVIAFTAGGQLKMGRKETTKIAGGTVMESTRANSNSFKRAMVYLAMRLP